MCCSPTIGPFSRSTSLYEQALFNYDWDNLPSHYLKNPSHKNNNKNSKYLSQSTSSIATHIKLYICLTLNFLKINGPTSGVTVRHCSSSKWLFLALKASTVVVFGSQRRWRCRNSRAGTDVPPGYQSTRPADKAGAWLVSRWRAWIRASTSLARIRYI